MPRRARSQKPKPVEIDHKGMRFVLEVGGRDGCVGLYCESPLKTDMEGFVSMRQPLGDFFQLPNGIVKVCVFSGRPLAMHPGASLEVVIQAEAGAFYERNKHLLKS